MNGIEIKDRPPEESVRIFKEALKPLGLRFRETWLTEIDGAYSMSLCDDAHCISVNGKGTSRAFCMASAYGEAVERIQSRMSYEACMQPTACMQPIASMQPTPKAADHLDFTDWPDEEMRPLREAMNCAPIAPDLAAVCADETEEGRAAFLSRCLGGESAGFVPYYSVREKRTVMLPDRAISLMCGSNGLASGNTNAEALCQALCEVLERYAKFAIYKAMLTPPAVPDEYLQSNAPEAFALKTRIEVASGYSIIVRDASMGRRLPVANVLLVDKRRQRYFTKFGAHPRFDAALTRCLTELLQGGMPGDPAHDALLLSEWSEAAPDWRTGRNLMSSYRSDIAYLPEPFLAGAPSWEFAPWPEYAGFSNPRAVRELASLALTLSPDVYVRATGFLGVPTYRVYIPGVSALPVKLSQNNLRYRELSNLIRDIDRRAATLTRAEAEEIAAALAADDATLGSQSESFPRSISPRMLRALLLYTLGRDAEIPAALRFATTPAELCLKRYVELSLRGVTGENRAALINTFFDADTASRVCRALDCREAALSTFLDPIGLMSMLHASRADAEEKAGRARQEELSRLHMRIKLAMKKGMPSQEHAAELF